MGACNVSYSFAWFCLLRVPGLSEDLKSPVAVWSQPILSILSLGTGDDRPRLGLTFYFQSRKTTSI